MKVVHVASELFPYVKSGGLADSVAAQAKALAGFGHDVAVIVPGYRKLLAHPDFAHLKPELELRVEMRDGFVRGEVYIARISEHETIYAVRRDEYFDRENLYGIHSRDYDDNAERFIFFNKAVVDVLHRAQIKADVVHCHDWQTGLVPVLIRAAEQQFDETLALSTVITIHNVAFQGVFPSFTFDLTGLPAEFFSVDGLEYYGQMSMLKGGIVFADRVMTVSPTYASEIRTPEFGCGMEGVINSRASDLIGLLNGIDTEVWNPATDTLLPGNFTADDLKGKAVCRRQLLKQFGFAAKSAGPIFGMVCRLTEQKGLDFVLAVSDFFVENDAHLVVLGSGNSHYGEALAKLAAAHPQRIAFDQRLDEAMSHLIEAGSDFFLMPSLFEPCGLNQMYSLHYGTIPVVTRVGGLVDTVIDIDENPDEGTGIMTDTNAASLRKGLKRALALYQDKPLMRKIIKRAMSRDFSWSNLARANEALYRDMI